MIALSGGKTLYVSDDGHKRLAKRGDVRPVPRFDMVLGGKKHMRFPRPSETADVMMMPGEIHYCPPGSWKQPLWDRLHEMSSLVIYPEYVRVTYIKYDKISDYYDSHGAPVFYHTAHPLGDAAGGVLRLFDGMTDKERCDAGMPLVTALLGLVRRQVEEDTPHAAGKSRQTYLHILRYLQSNFHFPINRDAVARKFGLSPSYVSRLFAKEHRRGFIAELRRMRMEHAAYLLRHTDFPIKAITKDCGYESDTFFIAAFREQYGMPPGQYRLARPSTPEE